MEFLLVYKKMMFTETNATELFLNYPELIDYNTRTKHDEMFITFKDIEELNNFRKDFKLKREHEFDGGIILSEEYDSGRPTIEIYDSWRE